MCLRCRQGRLHATGAFHVCDVCGLAVTEQALRHERAAAGNGYAGGGDGQEAIGRGARHGVRRIGQAGEHGQAGEAGGTRAPKL